MSGANVSVVRIVIAGGGNSQNGSLILWHVMIASALAIRLALLYILLQLKREE
jgi:hypothetical protein